jgi:hypothetical protein
MGWVGGGQSKKWQSTGGNQKKLAGVGFIPPCLPQIFPCPLHLFWRSRTSPPPDEWKLPVFEEVLRTST